ncbi:MAG TPA: hypothetical protein VLT58_08295, partial [Polyangia bacterium]|nr:hypothetical protein [Polyangia bacterium]
VLVGVLLGPGCAGVKGKPAAGGGAGGNPGSGGGAGGRATGTGGLRATGGAGIDAGPAVPPLTDFPPDPVIVTGAPSNAPALFSTAPRASGAPCLLAPAPGTLMPRNWLRPRFEVKPSADENLYEITLAVPSFAHKLAVYTTARTYTLDAALWDGLRAGIFDQPIAVTVRALTLSGSGTVQNPPSPPATGDFTIAPVDAPGKIVYWAIPNGYSDGILRGFGIGEESVEDVLVADQLVPPTIDSAQKDGCIGCHAATPDGLSVGFQLGPQTNSNGPDSYYDSLANIGSASVGQRPAWATTGQLAAIRALRGIPAYSRSHWTDGDHVALLMDGQNQGQLLWVNLDTDGAQGTIARTGDSMGASEPSFSHDGTRIVYVSGSSLTDGRLGNGPADLYTVPYANRAGGAATQLSGAADPAYTEYYPSFSPDDSYVAFTRFSGNGNSYSNNQAEVFVVPSAGGQALRFGANDPLACQNNQHSPGVANDWPKWSPEAASANGKTYYWVTFSSTRSGRPQLYVAPMTVAAGAVNVDYPALYLWNQPANDDNHTPSWDDYQIPPIIIDRP